MLSESETESKQKSQEKQGPVPFLICFQLDTQYKNLKYRSTSLCQTCLSRIHGICRSDHPFPSISPLLFCISNLFMSNSVITKSRLCRSGFSFPKISFPLLYNYLCRSKFCVGQKIKQYECQTK